MLLEEDDAISGMLMEMEDIEVSGTIMEFEQDSYVMLELEAIESLPLSTITPTILQPSKLQLDLSTAIELYKSGKSLRQIARKLGVYHQLVARELRNAGVIGKNLTKDTTMFVMDIGKAVSLYEDGYSCYAISKRLGVSQSKTIKKRLQQNGIEFEKPRNAHKRDTLDNEQIKKLFESDMNFRQIAIQLGTSAPTIKSRLKKMGLV